MATKEELEAAKVDLQIAELEAKKEQIKVDRKITKVGTYLEFAFAKMAGLVGTTVGGLEMLDPTIIPAVIPNPEIALGVGLAFLAGKKVVGIIADVATKLGGK